MSTPIMVKVSDITESPIALRDVDQDKEEFVELVRSIEVRGFQSTIIIRPRREEEEFEEPYVLIDGLQRLTAARINNIEEVPCLVSDGDELTALETQLVMNAVRVETKPIEYSQQLKRILAAQPLYTSAALAAQLGKSPAWIKQRLNLINNVKNQKIQQLIDDGEIVLSNAFALAKLPEDEQVDFLEFAQTEGIAEFGPRVNNRVAEINKANRTGKDAPKEFTPTAHFRRLTEITAEAEEPKELPAIFTENEITDPLEAMDMTLRWVRHLDPPSIVEQQAKFEANKAAAELRKAKSAAKRKKDAAEKARKNAEEAEQEARKLEEEGYVPGEEG